MGSAALEKCIREGIDGTPLVWARGSMDADGPAAAVIAGAALLLADLRRGQPLTLAATAIHWPGPHALPGSVAAALAGAPASDSRSAVAAMLAAAAARAGFGLVATADGIAWG